MDLLYSLPKEYGIECPGPRLQAPHMSKKQLLSSNKTPIQGVKRRGYPQEREDGQIKIKIKIKYSNLKTGYN